MITLKDVLVERDREELKNTTVVIQPCSFEQSFVISTIKASFQTICGQMK